MGKLTALANHACSIITKSTKTRTRGSKRIARKIKITMSLQLRMLVVSVVAILLTQRACGMSDNVVRRRQTAALRSSPEDVYTFGYGLNRWGFAANQSRISASNLHPACWFCFSYSTHFILSSFGLPQYSGMQLYQTRKAMS